ncbi:hypothetical protein E7811_16645 [Aliigemmobacter aestuarii]|uniref:RNase NYN domain-containing protein n=1 Tax=Aliigemmobacter aestuarii TaxID=1445661 RepID=A0A4S3MKH4_9RHOB|nr:hypothetical protein [Gemmobacter aestuarii]THD81533.1 hypothetical protein E7811_16645 [Gemmobacter aestuarii]
MSLDEIAALLDRAFLHLHAAGLPDLSLIEIVAALALTILFFQLFRWVIGLLARLGPKRPVIIVDGSNVMHWDDGEPKMEVVGRVVQEIVGWGFDPVIWFDANVGYKVSDRYLGPQQLATALGVPAKRINVAPKGTPADPLLLTQAVQLGAQIVTNDRYRDWEESHPRIREPGFLIRGRVTGSGIDLPRPAKAAKP